MNSDLSKIKFIIVVGATQDRDKWGYKTLMRLGQLGYRVMGVNPKYGDIERVKCLKSVTEVTEGMLAEFELTFKQVMVLTVVPPTATEEVLDDVAKSGITKVWFQKGSGSAAAEKKAKELGLEVIGTDCIVVDGLKNGWGDLDQACKV